MDLAGAGSWCDPSPLTMPDWEDINEDLTVDSAVDQSTYQCRQQTPWACDRDDDIPASHRAREKYQSYISSSNGPIDDEDFEDPGVGLMITQPETRSISQEQLIAEVKGIYAGLVMVESKCMEADSAQSSQPNAYAKRASNDQWRALVALHRTLFQEHHDFVLASQHPAASPALRRLHHKYGPASTWNLSSILFPERYTHRNPGYVDYLLKFITLAESMNRLIAAVPMDWLFENANGELLEWLLKAEDIFDRLLQRFRKYDYQLLIYALLFFRFFSEFPNGMRHLCTTMPWTIWPALVVLWGVCWMFYSSAAQEKRSGGEDTTSLLPPHQQQQDQQDQQAADTTGPHFLTGFGVSPTAHPEPEDLWDLINLPMSAGADPSIDELLFHLSDETLGTTNGGAWMADWPSRHEATILGPASCVPQRGAMPDAEIALAAEASGSAGAYEGFSMPALAFPLSALTPKQEDAPIFTSGVATTGSIRTVTALAIPPISSSPLATQEPPQQGLQSIERVHGNAKLGTASPAKSARVASLRCSGCGRAFSRRDALQRHMREQKHAGAGQVASPGSASAAEFLCPHAGCNRAKTGSGFKRRDKLEQHRRIYCKARLRRGLGGPLAALPALPSRLPKSRPDSMDDGLPAPQEGSPDQEVHGRAESEEKRLCSDDMLTTIQRRYQAIGEDIRAKEVELQCLIERKVAFGEFMELLKKEDKE